MVPRPERPSPSFLPVKAAEGQAANPPTIPRLTNEAQGERRKLKCSRQQPTCSHCSRLGAQCVYEVRKGKPGLKTGAVEALSRRLDLVEQALSLQERHPPSPTNPPPNDPTAPLLQVLSSLAGELHDLNSAVSRDDSSFRHKRRRMGDSTPASSYNLAAPVAETNDTSTLPDLVTDDILGELLNVYFSHIQPWIPIIREPSFRARVAHSDRHDSKLRLILHSMTYAALRFASVDGKPLPPEIVARETAKSRRAVLLTAMTGLSIENLQALIIIAFIDIGDGQCQAAWPLVGSLARSAANMQLSVEPSDARQRHAILGHVGSLDPPANWIEEEERRRVFWNIFILDRMCSIATGWNTSLTAVDVNRRLPSCGGHWYRNEPSITPYFGIWDDSSIKLDTPISLLPAHQTRSPPDYSTFPSDSRGAPTIDMSKVGAFGYYVESIESLSRITTHFLNHPSPPSSLQQPQQPQQQQQQQRDEDEEQQSLYLYLTRFKEFDLRLVHWKMHLPRQWRDSGRSRAASTGLRGAMDPNMTVANATHNVSTMLLHQKIGYPPPPPPPAERHAGSTSSGNSNGGGRRFKHDTHGGSGSSSNSSSSSSLRLPSEYSADTCRGAALETAAMLTRYLEQTASLPVSPQLGLCAFVAGRVLVVHAAHYGLDLEPAFWSLVASLEVMAARWRGGNRPGGYSDDGEGDGSLFGELGRRLRHLEAGSRGERRGPAPPPPVARGGLGLSTGELVEDQFSGRGMISNDVGAASQLHQYQQQQTPGSTVSEAQVAGHSAGWGQNSDLAVLSQDLMGKSFTELDRIINSDELLFSDMAELFPGGMGDYQES